MTASNAPEQESSSLLSLGRRLHSAACTTEVVVITLPAAPLTVACGGLALSPTPTSPPSAAPAGAPDVTLVGKRYVDGPSGLELLCVKSGIGRLTADGRELTLKAANALPASD